MMQSTDLAFSGVQWADIESLGLSQIYLNADKLARIREWFDPNDLSGFEPLPVHDFGNARLTLTDGHSRAYTAYRAGLQKIPVVYDLDPIVTSDTGLMLYRDDIVWCERFGIRTVRDLENRILSGADYQTLWLDRCSRAYVLLTQTTPAQRSAMQEAHPGLYLYGASADLKVLYFEDAHGALYEFPNIP